MNEVFEVLNDAEARMRVQRSTLSAREVELHLAFVDHFTGARFFANTPEFLANFQADEEVTLPAWAVTHLTTLSGAFPAEGSLHFAFSSFMPGSVSPLEDLLDTLWFSLDYTGWPSNTRQRRMLQHAGAGISLFPIGEELVDDGYHLAINVAVDDDTTIYQYHLDSLMANLRRGEDVMASVFPVFSTPGDMLSRVRAIPIRHGQTITTARRAS